MKRPFAALAALLAILALIAGAWMQGLAQGRPRASELVAMEICADGQIAVVIVDANGRPVAPGDCGLEMCLDCIPVPPLAVVTGPALLAAPSFALVSVVSCERTVRAGCHHAAKLPRGPPEQT